jgi:hypothetical protein
MTFNEALAEWSGTSIETVASKEPFCVNNLLSLTDG